MKRELKQSEKAANGSSSDDVRVDPKSADQVDKARRHRPSPVERSMSFFLKMHDWSRIFLGGESWHLSLKPGAQLDQETVAAISRAVREAWLEDGRSRTFRSVDELDRFATFKEKEVAYIEKQLSTMPSPEDPLWEDLCGDFSKLWDAGSESQPPLEEVLQGPADFLRDTLLPCLHAQVRSLRLRIANCRKLEDGYEELVGIVTEQTEIRHCLASLRMDRTMLLPVCPVWKEVGDEIARLEGKLLRPKAFEKVSHQKKAAFVALQDGLCFGSA
ncbi:hypothetical protein OQA88_2034 [Cercophora sp. LCS_1]